MNRFNFKELSIKDVFEIYQSPIKDERGTFTRLFCLNELKKIGWLNQISQINRTFTKTIGSIRGMHFQLPPASESKIIVCTRGEIFDVAVDLRKESKTFLKYTSVILSSKINNMILIPKGFAHGFQTLTKDVELIYFHDYEYTPKSEKGINPLDPLINVNWPIDNKIISIKDKTTKMLSEIDFKGI